MLTKGSVQKNNNMSWLQNLSKIKDEVTNFATEVLAPDVPESETSDPDKENQREIADQQFQEMLQLVATQDAEVGCRKEVRKS